MKKYVAAIITGSSLLLAIIGYFSWYVDPFCFFERNTYGMYWHTERHCKVDLINDRPDYEKLLVGNSRVAWIKPKQQSTLNVAFSGATLKEIHDFLEHFLQPQKTVYLGLDFEHLYHDSEDLNQGSAFEKSITDYFHHLFSFEIVSRSVANHFFRQDFKPSIPLGELGNREFRQSDHNKLEQLQEQVKAGTNIIIEEALTNQTKQPTQLQEKRELLLSIKNILDSRSTQYKVFINPIMPEKLKQLEEQGNKNWNYMKSFPDELREVFPDLIDLSINHGYPNNKFRDPSHFTPEVGADILKLLDSSL